ncbi:MAG: beta-ketoacyl-[acyl-carrier-protein] synthase family protein [Candidatus Parabeggiatoa sp.]|nr:beta-ketoacyl-[acyl-carrier-protein] synthase family protein [Candidatus Parabeggiatoa sp.]
MKKTERVVVTGMSTVNPLGQDIDEFWSACKVGTSGVKKVEKFEIPENMSQMAGIIDQIDLSSLEIPLEEIKQYDRSLLLALKATNDALKNSGLEFDNRLALKNSRWAVFVANAISHISNMEKSFCEQSNNGKLPLVPMKKGENKTNSFFFNTTNAEIAKYFGLSCEHMAMVTGCTGGVDAIGYAMQAIRKGQMDIVITGATEAPITPLVVAAFSKIGATSKRNHEPSSASRPFDIDRDGFVLAEGCGILILESLDHALRRGAKIYAEISGMGSVNNCYHMTDIPEQGMPIARACELAINDAGIGLERVDFINAHGSSTPQNDVAESKAFNRMFGSKILSIPVTSIKSQVGHTLSAANSIEVISSIMSIRDNLIPPTINLNSKDEKCELDVVANEARTASVNCVLKTSSGFSGIHSSLVIERWTN